MLINEAQAELSMKMIEELCGNDDKKWTEATNAVRRSLLGRLDLWDEIYNKIK